MRRSPDGDLLQHTGDFGAVVVNLAILALISLVAAAQAVEPPSSVDPPYAVTNWQTEAGLPENSATAMVQSPDGYLYFGTFNGLVRFDGKRFAVLNQRNTPVLPNVGIVNLHIGADSSLWVSTLGGLVRHKDGGWKAFGPQDGWTGDYVRHSAEGPAGTIYFVTFDLKVFEYSGGRMRRLPQCPGRNSINFPFVGADGKLRLAGWDFLNTWNGSSWESVPLPEELRRSPAKLGWGRSPGGRLWAITEDTAYRIETGSGRIEQQIRLSQPVGQLWSVTVEDSGLIWVCSYIKGLFRISDSGEVYHFSAADGLDSNSIRYVFLDGQGNRWVGSSGAGLFRLRERRFTSIAKAQGLPSFPVKAIATESDGTALMATYGSGVMRFSEGKVTRFETTIRDTNFSQTILRDRAGRLWIGRYGQALVLREGGVARLADPAVTGGKSTLSLFEGSRGDVWMAGDDGVARFDGRKFRPVKLDRQYAGVPVRCFAEDRQTGTIWAGGDAGLFRMDGKTDGKTGEKMDGLSLKSMRDEAGNYFPPVTFIHPADGDTLWVGAGPDSLLRWRGGQARSIGADSLPLGVVGGIMEDRGMVWMATSRGVFRVPRAQLEDAFDGRRGDLTWQRFGTQDGLPSQECTVDHQPSMARDHQGRLWFSTLKGAAIINPADFHPDKTDVPVKIEELHFTPREGHAVSLQLHGRAAPRTVPAGALNVRLVFTAIELSDADQVIVKYELLRDGKAVAAGQQAERELSFTTLPYGRYQLTVRARNSDGMWSKHSAQMDFEVEPTLWERRSFRFGLAMLCALMLTSATVVLSRRLMRRRMDRLMEEKRKAEEETLMLQAQKLESLGRLAGGMAHDFNNLLTVVNGNSELLLLELPEGDKRRKKIEDIGKAGAKGAELTRQLLLYSRREPVELSPLDLNLVVEEMLSIVQTMVGPRVRVELHLEKDLLLVRTDRSQVSQVLMNLIVNARDAMPGGGMVMISTETRRLSGPGLHGEYVVLTVADTGEGMDEATKRRIFEPFFTTKRPGVGTGMGLSTVQALVQNAQGWIEVEASPGQGARFEVFFPTALDQTKEGGLGECPEE